MTKQIAARASGPVATPAALTAPTAQSTLSVVDGQPPTPLASPRYRARLGSRSSPCLTAVRTSSDASAGDAGASGAGSGAGAGSASSARKASAEIAVKAISRSLTRSTFLQTMSRLKRDAVQEGRAVTEEEAAALAAHGNHSSSPRFSNVRVLSATLDTANIRNCILNGSILLGGSFSGSVELDTGVAMACGLYNSVLHDCTVESDCLVMGTQLIAKTMIRSRAVVLGCGMITCSGTGSTFGNGVVVPLGLDGDGRNTACYAEITVKAAAELACRRDASSQAMQAAYAACLREYVAACSAPFCVIDTGARVTNCARLRDVYIGEGAQIDASQLTNATVLSSSDEVTAVEGGSVVNNAVLQWGCHVSQMGIVEQSVLCEHSHVDKHGKVLGSLLGPNSGVSEGEVNACLVGPFVGFHHQALLIASMWPEGKGNVGYGANVGSNHTGKAPDQELRPGEGVFFGLGTSIKFPANYEASPYSIIATGCVTLPQKVNFPFSLINLPGETIKGISPAFNELFAGWVLSDSVFTIWRNESKFSKRDKARRERSDARVFRPRNIDLMISARARLQAAKPAKHHTSSGEAVFTDREVSGLGKNYLRKANLDKGIKAYTFYIQLYALQGLYDAVNAGVLSSTGSSSQPTSEQLEAWAHVKGVLSAEFGSVDHKTLLGRLPEMQKAAAEACQKSKAKDSFRGGKIIPGYDNVHEPARSNKIVKDLHAKTATLSAQVPRMLSRL